MKVIIDIPTNPSNDVIFRNGVSFCGGFVAEREENYKLAAKKTLSWLPLFQIMP